MNTSHHNLKEFSPQAPRGAFLVIAGNIGSGKTTLTNLLANHLQFQAHFESVEDNPYLGDFYANMSRWSFPLQVHFLTHRFKAHQKILDSGASSIQDRSIYEDANIFARALHEDGKMDKRDYDNYLRLYNVMTDQLAYPSLVIYLKRSVPKLLERISLRGRDYEKQIPQDYLERLNSYYEDWFLKYDQGKAVKIDTDELDFIENPRHFKELVSRILSSFDQKDFFLQPNHSSEIVLQ
jgi:deoxyadenosine/deoxycytidine kinase